MAPAPKVYNNPSVKLGVGGAYVDLSGWADKATVEESLNKVDVTTFGAQNNISTPGLGDGKITVEFFTDYQTSGSNATLRSMFVNSRAGTPGSIEIIPNLGAAVSASNPRITMICHLYNYTGFDGAISDASKFTAEFDNAGTAGVTWGTV
jgi:hypothetical protein